jgi:hypothetical protein
MTNGQEWGSVSVAAKLGTRPPHHNLRYALQVRITYPRYEHRTTKLPYQNYF